MNSSRKNLTRRMVLQQAMAAMAVFTLERTVAAEAPATKPNVLFIAIDDLRPELNCYGRPWIKSPSIDALAQRGIVFDHAYCQQSVCSPSRSSLMTGTRPDSTKVWDLKTHFRVAEPNVVTLNEQFKNNGYFAQAMGKIYHPGFEDPQSWSVPWQTPKAPVYAKSYDDAPERSVKKKTAKHEPSAEYVADDDKPMKQGKNGPAFEAGEVDDNFYKDGLVAELAVKTLGELSKKNQPFFLAVGFAKPHLPFNAPRKYWDLYDEQAIQLAPNPFHPHGAPDYAVNTTGELRQYMGIPSQGPIDDKLARQLKHGYFASVSYSDAQVGKVVAELDRLGLAKNTVIVFWGDHGWKLGEHGEWTKHSNVENDTNAPLIVVDPKMKRKGTHTAELVEFVDIYPTLCDLAGLPKPGFLEGTSFVPLLNKPNRPWKKAAFSQYPRKGLMGYTMRTKEYRFTIWLKADDRSQVDAIELYDQKADAQENENIANKPENAELVKRLKQQWMAGWKAALPPAA